MGCCSNRQPEGQTVHSDTLYIFSKISGWTGRAAARRVHKVLSDSIGRDMIVLDIGTGPGTIPINLKRYYPDVHFMGLDISLGMIRMAQNHRRKANLPMSLLVGNGESLPFGSGEIDGVICFFSMHHMDHPRKLFLEIDRVLKPGGPLLIIDFRRDMPEWLFKAVNLLWQLIFYFSAGRTGFKDSARSAWRPDEIETLLRQSNISRFNVHSNRLELWITTK